MKGKSFDDMLQGSSVPQKPVQSKPVATEADEAGPCAAKPEPSGCVSLCVINTTEASRGFQYAHLGFASYAADGLSFVVEFNEPEKWRLTVRGRRLWRVFIGVHQHRLEWIKKADRDFDHGAHAVITEILIEKVDTEEEAAED